MTRDKMIEALVDAMIAEWKRVDPSSGVAMHPTSYVATFADLAAAVLDLCGPEPLVWHKSDMSGWNGDYHTSPTAYTVRCADENGWKWACLGRGAYGWEHSPESAQAAAQSHATAAHWASTPLGKLVGVV
jgi:Tfp pilus assembly protein PilV